MPGDGLGVQPTAARGPHCPLYACAVLLLATHASLSAACLMFAFVSLVALDQTHLSIVAFVRVPCNAPGTTWPKGTKLTAYRERHLVLRVPTTTRQSCEYALRLPRETGLPHGAGPPSR